MKTTYSSPCIAALPSFVCLLLALMLTSECHAQNWDWQNPLPQGVNLFGLHFPDDSTGYTVGMDGTILKTVNGGQDWLAQESGVGTTFESVFFPHPDTGYAVGYGNNTFHKTTNGGADWVEIADAAQALTDVFFLNTNLGYAVGSNGVAATVIKTTNGGEDWVVQHTGTVTFYNAVYFVNDTVGWIAGGGGRLLKTTNGGQSWVTQTSGTTQTIQSLYFHDELNGYGVSYGRIIKTTNGGATWTSTTIFQAFELYDVKFTDWNTGVAVGRSGIILRTTNAGASWSIVPTGTNITLRAVSFMDDLHGVVVGESGITLTTSDAGVTWTPFSTSIYYEDLNDTYFASDCNGFAVGDNGAILKTMDGGANWIAQNSGFTNELFGVHFTSEEIGYVVGESGLIAKTNDGGTTWSTQTSGLTTDLMDVFFTSVDTGFVVGTGGYIRKTIDGGANWTAITNNITNNLTGIHFVDATIGFIVGSSGRVMKTIDGGNTWNILFSGTTLDLNGVYFPTAQVGYIVGVSGHIRKTINGGTNWTQQTNNINIALTSIAFTDANTGIAVGYDYNRYGKIYQTSNGGSTWSVETISWDHDLNAVLFVDPNTITMVGNNGAILKTRMPSTTAVNTGAVCEGETIALHVDNIAGATYAWSGPNDFASNLQNPTIEQATLAMGGEYTVLISWNDCTSNTATTTITVHEAPDAPAIIHQEQLCVGEPFSLTTPSLTNANYSWTGPNGFSSTEQQPFANVTADLNLAGTYTLAVTQDNCTSAWSEATIDIQPLPAPPVIVEAGPFCEGAAAALAVSAVANASYQWTGPNGFSAAEQNPVLSTLATLDLNGVYAVTATVNGCTSDAAEANMIIYALPSTPVIQENGLVCEGDSLWLSTPSLTGAIYTWTGPNGFTSSLQNPLVQASAEPNGSGTYMLTTTVNNCTSASASTQIEMVLRPETPTASNNGPLCEGAVAALSAPSIADALYFWTGPNGFTSAEQNPLLATNASEALNGDYQLITSVGGCESLAAVTTVQVNSIPSTPEIITTAGVCEGASLALSTTMLPDATYSWSGPNGFVSNEQNPLVSAMADAAMQGTYSLTIAVNNCTSPTAEAFIAVQPVPATPVIANLDPLCEGTALALVVESITDATFLWTGPNGFTSTEQNPVVSSAATVAMSGTYALVAALGNCTSEVAEVVAVVHATPASPIASSNGPVDEGETLSLLATTIEGAGYVWTGPNGFASTEQNPSVSEAATLDMAGTYSVIAVVNGCESATSSVVVVVNEGNSVAGPTGPMGMRVYPNPASEALWLERYDTDLTKCYLVNALGEIVLEMPIRGQLTEVNIRTLAPGVYGIVLFGEGKKVEKKLVIQ